MGDKEKWKKHLCDTCRLEATICAPKQIQFGIDVDPAARGAAADIVLRCSSYRPNVMAKYRPDAKAEDERGE